MPPKGPEYVLQGQVLELASICGWQTLGVRGAWDKRRGFTTPTIGSLAKGWLDLTLFRSRAFRRQMYVVELKSDTGRLTDEQKATIEFLSQFSGRYVEGIFSEFERRRAIGYLPEVQFEFGVFVWRPRDFDLIQTMLK